MRVITTLQVGLLMLAVKSVPRVLRRRPHLPCPRPRRRRHCTTRHKRTPIESQSAQNMSPQKYSSVGCVSKVGTPPPHRAGGGCPWFHLTTQKGHPYFQRHTHLDLWPVPFLGWLGTNICNFYSKTGNQNWTSKRPWCARFRISCSDQSI